MGTYKPVTTSTGLFIVYDLMSGTFTYSEKFCRTFCHENPGSKNVWQVFEDNDIARSAMIEKLQILLTDIGTRRKVYATSEDMYLKNITGFETWYRLDFLFTEDDAKIYITLTNISDMVGFILHLEQLEEYDELTGLYTKTGFKRQLDKQYRSYAVLMFDICHFKAINDYFGKAGGDLLLIHIADAIRTLVSKNGFGGRIVADRFVVCVYTDTVDVEQFSHDLLKRIKQYELSFNVLCNIGIYINNPNDDIPSATKMDRAAIAQSVIKGNYEKKVNFYTEELSTNLVNEQSILANMVDALETEQFVLYYQPQYSHVNEKIVGAEALVRWKHPDIGLIPPNIFIPVFEKHYFISALDMYVFEHACRFIKKCIDEKIPLVPVSTNFSRYDVVQKDFVEKLEVIRNKYKVPVDYLRIEITESAVVGGSEYVSEIVKKLQNAGYVVEMDDFGSGYSSLNVLKDINFNIIKLDMKFMYTEEDNQRGSKILKSVVAMGKALGMVIIAEGVETIPQADFLRDIGCDIIQGYLYSKPLPEEDYINRIKENLS